MTRATRLSPKEKARIERLLTTLEAHHPNATTELNFGNTFQLLIAVILSAQCTDKRVNMVTEGFFARYPDAEAMARLDEEGLLAEIKSINFAPTKAKNIYKTIRMLLDLYGGEVPGTRDALEALPGVGRKTANVVLATAFDVPALAVDTHVFRVSKRLGMAKAETPEETERQLERLIPREKWSLAHHWLILHGRYTCTARKPLCDRCPLTADCPEYARLTKPMPVAKARPATKTPTKTAGKTPKKKAAQAQ
jgi:endonuclease III